MDPTNADATDTLLTLGDYADLPEEDDERLELSHGRLVREPAPGPLHGHVVLRIARILSRIVDEADAGLTFVGTAFTLSRRPATVRVPDIAFVTDERVPAEGLGDAFWELAPDLAVEVVSPSNSTSDIQRKALEYLDSGSRLVWVVDPRERTVTSYRSRHRIRILEPGEVLEADDLVAGLRLPVEDLFG